MAAHGRLLQAAIEQFAITARQLTLALAAQLDAPATAISEEWRFQIDDDRQVGEIDNGTWEYMFHGAECLFRSAEGDIDVALRDFGTFSGLLRPYRLWRFLDTAPAYTQLAGSLRDQADTEYALELLAAEGVLARIEAAWEADAAV